MSQPRSGSTLLQTILSGHPQVGTYAEPWILLPYLSVLKGEGINAVYDQDAYQTAIKDFLANSSLSREQMVSSLRTFLLSLYQNALGNQGPTYFLDKTPRYYEILDEITEVFPNARIIVLKRDPLEVVRSIIHFGKARNIFGLLWWHRDILLAPLTIQHFAEKNKQNPNVLVTHYHEIVDDPKNTVSTLFRFLHLEFDERYLDLNSSKLSGRMGDTTILKTKSVVRIEKSEDDLPKRWNAFFDGYAHYLNKKIPGITKRTGVPTFVFRQFERYSSFASGNVRLKQLLLYLYFRFRIFL